MPMSPRLLRPKKSFVNPSSISGLISWYDSADSSSMAQNTDGTGAVTAGTQVGYWKDKSKTAAHLTQSTAANRPTWTANAVNNKTALVFDGTNDTLALSSGYTAQNSLAGLTRFMVGSSSQNCISVTTGNNGPTHSFQSFGLKIYTYSASGVQIQASEPSIMSLRVYASVFSGSSLSLNLYFNNVLQSIVGTGGTIGSATGSGGTGLWIGSNQGLNNFHGGAIAEYVAFSKALNATEMKLMYDYLKMKWGL